MNLIDIAFSSLKKQKSKKLFLLLAMVLGCATVLTLFTFIQSQRNKIESQFDEYGANIVIMPKTDQLMLSYGGINVSGVVANVREIDNSDIEKIYTIPNRKNIRAVSPKLLGAVSMKNNGKESDVLLIGVDFEQEIKIKSWWEFNGQLPQAKDELILGAEAAKKLGLKPNDYVLIGERELQVKAVLASTGSQDDEMVFARMDTASEILNKEGKVSLIEVSALCSDCPIDKLITQISSVLPQTNVRGIKQVMKQKMVMVEQFEKFAVTVTAVIILIGGILVFISMMGSIAERKYEVGIFRAIGFMKKHIMQIILIEAFIISLAAGIIGSFFGYAITYFLLPPLTGIDRSLIVFDPLMIGITILSAVILGLVSTIYPAYSAAEIDPVKIINNY
ncbi:MAG: FtsX-like permease family protein [Candidatus Omnitrophota bacterium]